MNILNEGPGEEIIFSCYAVKYNKYSRNIFNKLNTKLERKIMITGESVYSINEGSVQREVKVMDLRGLTKNTKEDSTEFVIHVDRDYDFIFESDRREVLFKAIKYVYWNSNRENIPVYGIADDLHEYHTKEEDIAERKEYKPDQIYLLPNEDLYSDDLELMRIAQ